MIFDCGPTRRAKSDAKKEWHMFFALWPRRIGPRECVWLGYIERKGTLHPSTSGYFWDWEYRKRIGDNS